MGNLFSQIGTRVGDLVSYPVKMSKDLVTDPKKGFSEMKGLYTHNTHKDQDLFQKGFGIKGWVGDHPQESAAAVVGTIFGGWAAAGAYGGGAAAGAGGAAGASGGAAGAGAGAGAGTLGVAGTGASAGAGGVGISAYMAPAAAGGVGTTGTGTALTTMGATSTAATGAGTAGTAGSSGILASQAPATASLINMGNAGVGASSATAGSSTFTPAMLTTQGAAASGGTYGAASAPAATSALGTVPASTSAPASSSFMSNPENWQRIQSLMKSVNSDGDKQSQQAPPIMNASAPRGGFNFDGKNLQNSALTKTYSQLYNSPSSAARINF